MWRSDSINDVQHAHTNSHMDFSQKLMITIIYRGEYGRPLQS